MNDSSCAIFDNPVVVYKTLAIDKAIEFASRYKNYNSQRDLGYILNFSDQPTLTIEIEPYNVYIDTEIVNQFGIEAKVYLVKARYSVTIKEQEHKE